MGESEEELGVRRGGTRKGLSSWQPQEQTAFPITLVTTVLTAGLKLGGLSGGLDRLGSGNTWLAAMLTYRCGCLSTALVQCDCGKAGLSAGLGGSGAHHPRVPAHGRAPEDS